MESSNQVKPPIMRLPREILEAVAVLFSHNPSAIAALAQSCRAFHSLVYDSTDDHIWRRLYLDRFDDPRESAYLRLSSDQTIDFKFDWGGEYRLGTWSLEALRRRGIDYAVERDHSRTIANGAQNESDDLRAVPGTRRSVLALLRTARPLEVPTRLQEVGSESRRK